MASLKRTMFRQYDIRGRETPDELNENSAYLIARGFGAMLRVRGVREAVVGHDARATSERFHAAALRALQESGVHTVDIGLVTTPMSYWARFHFGIDGLCMITASHNPAGWNGFKLGLRKESTLEPADIEELYGTIEHERFSTGMGETRREEIRNAYFDDLLSRISIARPLSVLVNTGNGTAGLFAPELLRRAGCKVVEHLTNVDPTYPRYTANPSNAAMMEDTGLQTKQHACDAGVAFDGDGDRIGVVDEKGNEVRPDIYLMLLSRLVLAKRPGSPIVFDVTVSEALPEDIRAHGGIPVMWKTGHSYIRTKMEETGAPLAGEGSGHVSFGQEFYWGFDDAFFAGLKLLEYFAGEKRSVSALVTDIPRYETSPVFHADTTDEAKYDIVEKLAAEFRTEGHRIIDLSGARVYMENGWGLVRASSNTPSLVLRFEAKTADGMKKIERVFREKLSRFKDVNPDWNTSG